MWFRRRRRRTPPPELQPSLDRLAELVGRVVELLDDGRPRPQSEARAEERERPQAVWLAVPEAPREPEPEPEATPEPEAKPEPAPEPEPEPRPEPPAPAGWLAFVHSADGYRLFDRPSAPPARGEVVELDGARLRVVRVAPSPLPGDRRRCAYLEGEEPPAPERTSDG